MSRRVRPVSRDDRLTPVEHLDELRIRLIVSIAAFGVALGLCLWQSDRLLELAAKPLPDDHERLLTFGVTEPFTTTITVAVYGALILSLPVLLYQAYAYILPAFSRKERRVLLPVMLLAPVLFIGGVVFAYFIVMPPAVSFLLGFNDGQFNVQVRARDYFSFFSMTMLAGGLIFQLPLAVIATGLGSAWSASPAPQEPAIRVSRPRDSRRRAARNRPGLDADPAGATSRALRVEYLAGAGVRRAGTRTRGGQTFDPRNGEDLMADDERRMLFDIRGRRKNVIRVIYAMLALLMAASLFVAVGPFNIGELVGGSGGGEAAKIFKEQSERIEERIEKEPGNPNPDQYLALTRARINAGNSLSRPADRPDRGHVRGGGPVRGSGGRLGEIPRTDR